MKWGEAELADLHADFAAAVRPILGEAEAEGLDVRRQSGGRSNARQAGLYATYLAEKAKFDRGERPEPPLPAAPAGKSAHNYSLCSREPGHRIGAAQACPECGAASKLAALALDVALLDANGKAIHCPPLALALRPAEWQQWAGILARHPLVRDGGAFKGRLDVVHFESAGWNVLDHSYRKP